MDSSVPPSLSQSARRLARTALALGQTRLDLLCVEILEERGRWLKVLVLTLAGAVFGLLTAVVFTFGIVVALWPISVWLAILVPLVLHGGLAAGCVWRLVQLVRAWEFLPATLDQLRQDREDLERWLT